MTDTHHSSSRVLGTHTYFIYWMIPEKRERGLNFFPSSPCAHSSNPFDAEELISLPISTFSSGTRHGGVNWLCNDRRRLWIPRAEEEAQQQRYWIMYLGWHSLDDSNSRRNTNRTPANKPPQHGLVCPTPRLTCLSVWCAQLWPRPPIEPT